MTAVKVLLLVASKVLIQPRFLLLLYSKLGVHHRLVSSIPATTDLHLGQYQDLQFELAPHSRMTADPFHCPFDQGATCWLPLLPLILQVEGTRGILRDFA